jgi:predicted SnoaL-like aldol condensation-catalyzing enzyme
VLADGDLVVTEGVFQGFAPVPLIGYDVWRVSGGRIVEHWDALGPNGTRAQIDAPSVDSAPVDENGGLVREWVSRVLVGADRSAIENFATSDALIPSDLRYVALHAVIADGDVVYTRSEGERDGAVIINDVWRVDGGRIVERWGLVAPVPATLPHSNGAF